MLPAGLRFSLVVYLITRVPVAVGVMTYVARDPRTSLDRILLQADGWWYVHIAQQGYSASLHPPLTPPTDYRHRYSDWAFFPGYPLIVRGLHALLDLPYLVTACVAAGVLGLLAVWAVYALAEAFGGTDAARPAALLVAAWPGSAAFSLPYSEGLFIAAAATSLLALHRSRWALAGVLGAVATLTRPTGLALVAAAAVAALVRLVRDRDLRPMLAPAIATCGAVSFVLFGWVHTGDPLVWRHAENLWHQHLDFNLALLHRSAHALAHPLTALHTEVGQEALVDAVADLLGLLLMVAMVVAAVALRRRLTATMVVYALVSTALILGYSAVGPRPRTVLAIVPGFVWLAMWLPRRVVLALAGAGLLGLAAISYAWAWRITP